MQIKCPHCQRTIVINPALIPPGKEKAMVKCPDCQQTIAFVIPKTVRQQTPSAERTLMAQKSDHLFPGLPKLQRIDNNMIIAMKPGKNILGRAADISFPDDTYISRKHCLIEISPKSDAFECVLTDDGSISSSGKPSTNGTFHNGTRLTAFDKIYLRPGDKIRIGRTELRVIL